MKVAIIGGGIIGLATALELRAQGVEQVVVFDPKGAGQEASIAAGGMLAPQKEAHAPGAFLDACLRSRTMWPAFATTVAELSGQPSTYRTSGILLSAMNDNEIHSLSATADWQRACSLRVELLSGDQARAEEPVLSPRVLGAAWFPDEHQIDPVAFVPALIEACRRRDVRFVEAQVTEVVEHGGKAIGVRHAAGLEEADQVVLAAGAWSSHVGARVPTLVEPIRGQMIELRGAALPTRILGGPRCYVIPRADGRAIAGTTEERAGFDKSVTVQGLQEILSAVSELCPGLAQATVSATWAGLRPFSKGELPVIGPGPLPQLVLATGHYRNGILLAPLTARLVSQVILGQRPSVELKPFRYDRVSS